ncbi:MAG: HEPN domain-containing protein [Candidatus Stahlbacteria bacterium]|nr:HEPN domain-containing protein [Candidatus Stahlbacteria bacterium]
MIDEYIKGWLDKADKDLKAVEHELSFPQEEILRDIVCFHCQQAVEKYLKGFLIYHKTEFLRTHDIKYLLEKCAIIDKDFAYLEIKELSSFAVEVRYPDDLYIPDMGEVNFYYELTKRIKELVLTKLRI